MNDNKKIKIDINGSISDSAKGIGQDAAGILLVAIIFGFLFAPMFAPLFEWVLQKDRANFCEWGHYDYEIVQRKLAKIKRTLWIVCIIGWIMVFLINTFWHYQR